MSSSAQRLAPPVFVALDFATTKEALHLVDALSADQCGLKVGKELFTREGPVLVRELVKRKFCVFLDLKFHDIPNTVAHATSAAADLGVWMLNVHASGGRAMMMAAAKALEAYGKDKPLLTAVTVLTSLSQQDLLDTGVQRNLAEQVSALAALAAHSGIDGVVCSAQEAITLRQQRGQDFVLVTPGIRLSSANVTDDQVRVVTPREAIANGSNYLVIGRPITRADNPLQVLRTINEDISYRK